MVTAVLTILGFFLTVINVLLITDGDKKERTEKLLLLVCFALLQSVMLSIALQNGFIRAEFVP